MRHPLRPKSRPKRITRFDKDNPPHSSQWGFYGGWCDTLLVTPGSGRLISELSRIWGDEPVGVEEAESYILADGRMAMFAVSQYFKNPCGYVLASIGRVITIDAIAVDPAARRNYLGWALVLAVIEVSDAKLRSIRVPVHNQNADGFAFFESLGFYVWCVSKINPLYSILEYHPYTDLDYRS